MKVKIFALMFFFILIVFTGKTYAQETGLTSIMSQNKIRTCLAGDPTITQIRNRDCKFTSNKDKEAGETGNKDDGDCEKFTLGSATAMHITGTCEAPNGCEIWHQSGPRAINGLVAKLTKVVNHVNFGKVDMTITGTFLDHVSHTFYAIGDAPIVIETGQGGAEGENQTQQIGQVSNFEFPQTQGSEQKCTTIYWDPFGRVFDAVSLEPISGVRTTLFQSPTKQLVLVPNNPVLTDNAGIYNILIDKEDDYYLDVTVPATHTFTESFDLNPKYSLIYSHIYSPKEVFHEAPLPVSIPGDFDLGAYHHDIPLQPKGEPYRNAVAEVIEGTLNQVDLGSFINYWGRVTFPMAKVCLVGEAVGVVSCANADKYGNFVINVDKVSVPQEFMEIDVEKVDLTELSKKTVIDKIMSFFVREVNAQSSITIDSSPSPTPTLKPGFSPILTYVEGYAYDESLAVVPMAKVSVKVKSNDEIFYETNANEEGFFIIYSDNLPFFEYYLEIRSPNGNVIKQSTAEFISSNQTYLESEDLNLITSTRGGEPIINPTTGQLNEKSSLKNQTNNQITPVPAKAAFNPAIVTLLIVIFLLVAITVGLALYIKKSKSV